MEGEQFDLFPKEIIEAKNRVRSIYVTHGASFHPSRTFWERISFRILFSWTVAFALLAIYRGMFPNPLGHKEQVLMWLLAIDAVGFVAILATLETLAMRKLRAIENNFREKHPDLVRFL